MLNTVFCPLTFIFASVTNLQTSLYKTELVSTTGSEVVPLSTRRLIETRIVVNTTPLSRLSYPRPFILPISPRFVLYHLSDSPSQESFKSRLLLKRKDPPFHSTSPCSTLILIKTGSLSYFVFRRGCRTLKSTTLKTSIELYKFTYVVTLNTREIILGSLLLLTLPCKIL